MRRKLALFAATLLMALATTLTFTSPTTTATTPGSCQTQCRVGYDKCVRSATNPGGLNHCGKAYQACLSGCR